MLVCNAANSDRHDSKCQVNQWQAYSTANSIVAHSIHTKLGQLHRLLSLLAQALLSALQERRERRALDVEEAAVAAAAAASAQSSKHDPAKGQWDFAQRAQRAALAEDQAAAASGVRSNKKGQHQRHGSASDREGPVHRQAAEVASPSACHCGHVLQSLPRHAVCLLFRQHNPNACCVVWSTLLHTPNKPQQVPQPMQILQGCIHRHVSCVGSHLCRQQAQIAHALHANRSMFAIPLPLDCVCCCLGPRLISIPEAHRINAENQKCKQPQCG